MQAMSSTICWQGNNITCCMLVNAALNAMLIAMAYDSPLPGTNALDRPHDLTRFNKICHPSQRPRWQVDKEAIGLSRVQQCSSTYSLPS